MSLPPDTRHVAGHSRSAKGVHLPFSAQLVAFLQRTNHPAMFSSPDVSPPGVSGYSSLEDETIKQPEEGRQAAARLLQLLLVNS